MIIFDKELKTELDEMKKSQERWNKHLYENWNELSRDAFYNHYEKEVN